VKVKVKDIAKAAGVSTTAVSLVLNGKPSRLSDATKEKIKRIAREMAFQTNSLDSVCAERVKTVGLILPNLLDSFYLKLFTQIEQYAYTMDYSVFTCIGGDETRQTCKAIESLATKNVDGLLLVAPVSVEHDDRLTKMLKVIVNEKIPLVLVDRAVYSIFSDFVTTDNKYGGKTAVLYLAEKGYKQIGCLAGPPNVYTVRKRFQGYREGLSAARLEYRDSLTYYGDFSKESGMKGAQALYERGCRAVFVADSLMAEGAVLFAKEQGLKIPDDFAIVSYDYVEPGVPCIMQNVSLMAEKAVDLLIEQINSSSEKAPPRNFYITPVLSQNESSLV